MRLLPNASIIPCPGRKCHILGKFFNVLPAAAPPTSRRGRRAGRRKGADGGEVFALPQTGGDEAGADAHARLAGVVRADQRGQSARVPRQQAVQGNGGAHVLRHGDGADGGVARTGQLAEVAAPEAVAGQGHGFLGHGRGVLRRQRAQAAGGIDIARAVQRLSGAGAQAEAAIFAGLVQRRFLRPRAGRGLFPAPRRFDGKAGAHALDGDEAVAAAPAEAVAGEDGLERQAEGGAGAVRLYIFIERLRGEVIGGKRRLLRRGREGRVRQHEEAHGARALGRVGAEAVREGRGARGHVPLPAFQRRDGDEVFPRVHQNSLPSHSAMGK